MLVRESCREPQVLYATRSKLRETPKQFTTHFYYENNEKIPINSRLRKVIM